MTWMVSIRDRFGDRVMVASVDDPELVAKLKLLAAELSLHISVEDVRTDREKAGHLWP
jgi:hypothetical protein